MTRRNAGLLFATPALAILTLVLVFPLLYSLALSFFSWNMLDGVPPRLVGLRNYLSLLEAPATWNSFRVTAAYVAVTLALEIGLGILVALFLHSLPPAMRWVRTLLLVPMMVAEVVIVLAWRFALDPDFGIVNYVLGLVGAAPQAWTDVRWALASIIVVDVWHNTSFVVLVVLAGLQAIPHDLIESAFVDGAGYWSRVRRVVLPLVNAQIIIALVFRTIFAMRVFTTPWVLTGGGPADRTMVIGISIYRTAFRYYDMGVASALSWMLVLVSVVLTVLYLRLFSREGGQG